MNRQRFERCSDSRRGVTLGRCLLVSAAVLGCERGVDVPEPPVEVAPIVAQYETPTGTVGSSASRLVAEILQEQELVDTSHIGEVVAEALTELRERLQESELPTSPSDRLDDLPELDGFVRVNRVCRGWDPDAEEPDAASNGTITLTATLEGGRLEPVIWGPARACRTRFDVVEGPIRRTVNGWIDGDVWVYLEGGLPASVRDANFILGFSGTLGSEDVRTETRLDFRFAPPQVEFRIPVSDGHVIASVGLGGIGVRAANGVFACTTDPAECQRIEAPTE